MPVNMLHHEHALWDATPALLLAGIDEAGRGPLAGPVVAAAVSMRTETAEALCNGALRGLTDSKRLTAAKRAHFFHLLHELPGVALGVGVVGPAEIDQINILNATWQAMRLATLALPVLPNHALVDGLPVQGLPCASTALVKGDARSLLIAAASVVAKVARDRMMAELDAAHPEYGFAKHKGYGTAAHIRALRQHGPCREHRRSFRPVADVLSVTEFNFQFQNKSK